MSSPETLTTDPKAVTKQLYEKIYFALDTLHRDDPESALPDPKENAQVFHAFLEATCDHAIDVIEQAEVIGEVNQEQHAALVREARELLQIGENIEFHCGHGAMHGDDIYQNVIGAVISCPGRIIYVGVGIDGLGQLHPYISRQISFGLGNEMTFPGKWNHFAWFTTQIASEDAPEGMIKAMREIVTFEPEKRLPHHPRGWLKMFQFRKAFSDRFFKRCKLAGRWPDNKHEWIVWRLQTQLDTTRQVGYPKMEARLLGFHVGRFERYFEDMEILGDDTNIVFWQGIMEAIAPEIARIEEGPYNEEYSRARDNEEYGVLFDDVSDVNGISFLAESPNAQQAGSRVHQPGQHLDARLPETRELEG